MQVGDRVTVLAAPYEQHLITSLTKATPKSREFWALSNDLDRWQWIRHSYTLLSLKGDSGWIEGNGIKKLVPLSCLAVYREPEPLPPIETPAPPIASLAEILGLREGGATVTAKHETTEDDRYLLSLCQWYLSAELPPLPLELRPAVTAREGWYEVLKRDAEAVVDYLEGRRPEQHPRHLHGLIQADLEDLRKVMGLGVLIVEDVAMAA